MRSKCQKGFAHTYNNISIRGAGESSAHLWISHLPHAPHQSTRINIFIHIKIIREKSSSVAKHAQQPAPGGQPRCESDVAPHFRRVPLGSGSDPLPPLISDSIWRTRSLRYNEPHAVRSTSRSWEGEMAVSLRRWWCLDLNCASHSQPGCTELLHRSASRVLRHRLGGSVRPPTVRRKSLRVGCWRSGRGGRGGGTILMLWARIKRCKGASRNKPLFEAWAAWF